MPGKDKAERVMLKREGLFPLTILNMLAEEEESNISINIYADPEDPINSPKKLAELVNGNYGAMFEIIDTLGGEERTREIKTQITMDLNSPEFGVLFNQIVSFSDNPAQNFREVFENVKEDKQSQFLKSSQVVMFLMAKDNIEILKQLTPEQQGIVRSKYDDMVVNTMLSHLAYGNLGNLAGTGVYIRQGKSRDEFFRMLETDDYKNLPTEKKNEVINNAINYFRGTLNGSEPDVESLARLAKYADGQRFIYILEGTPQENHLVSDQQAITAKNQKNDGILMGFLNKNCMENMNKDQLTSITKRVSSPDFSQKLNSMPRSDGQKGTFWHQVIQTIKNLVDKLMQRSSSTVSNTTLSNYNSPDGSAASSSILLNKKDGTPTQTLTDRENTPKFN